MVNTSQATRIAVPEENLIAINNKRFGDHLKESYPTVWFAATWFWYLGQGVYMPPLKGVGPHKNWRQNADSGDLYVNNKRWEIKQLSVYFTGMNDWPYKNKFIVCAKHSFDLARPTPYAYCLFNCDRTVAAMIFTEISDLWYVESRPDKRYGEDYKQDFYFCPIDKILFKNVDFEI